MSALSPAIRVMTFSAVGGRHLRAIAWAGVVLSAVTAYVTVAGGLSERPWIAAMARVAIFAIPLAVGLWEWRQRPAGRMGPLIVAGSGVIFIFTLAGSSNPVLYSLGRIGDWVVEIGVLALMLAFPTGRFAERADRLLAYAGLLLVSVLFIPTALFVDSYPAPAPGVTCSHGCPPDEFNVVAQTPAVIHDVVTPVREALAVLLLVAVAVRLARRVTRASWL